MKGPFPIHFPQPGLLGTSPRLAAVDASSPQHSSCPWIPCHRVTDLRTKCRRSGLSGRGHHGATKRSSGTGPTLSLPGPATCQDRIPVARVSFRDSRQPRVLAATRDFNIYCHPDWRARTRKTRYTGNITEKRNQIPSIRQVSPSYDRNACIVILDKGKRARERRASLRQCQRCSRQSR